MAMTVMFDAQGEAVAPTSATRKLTSTTSFAQGVNVVDRSSRLEVRFSHDIVSPVALTGLLIWLHDKRQKPIAVMGSPNTDLVEILPDRRRAVAYLSDLIAIRSRQSRFERRETDLGDTSFASVWRAAREICTAEMSDAARLPILDALLGGNFTLNTFEDNTGMCRMSAVGSMISKFDPRFAVDGKGATYRAMSDHTYGAWLAETLESYRDRDRPFAERISATVNYPLLPSRVHYTRLVVPFRAGERQHMLIASDVFAALN